MATVTAEIGLLVYNLSPQSQTQQSSRWGGGVGGVEWGDRRGRTRMVKKKKERKRIDRRELKQRLETGMVRMGQRQKRQKAD